ncbi:hypothetical protein ACFY41_09185 [Streptomyces syringium]|uniref:hypothetical protein n=1 Tax=Streptomyces syringium TaxID=76729 RepID=UPI00368A42E7
MMMLDRKRAVELTASPTDDAAVGALMAEPETAISDAPVFAPEAVASLLALLSPKTPKEPKEPKER